MEGVNQTVQLDLANQTVREVNHYLHHGLDASVVQHIEILNPEGNHSISAGLDELEEAQLKVVNVYNGKEQLLDDIAGITYATARAPRVGYSPEGLIRSPSTALRWP